MKVFVVRQAIGCCLGQWLLRRQFSNVGYYKGALDSPQRPQGAAASCCCLYISITSALGLTPPLKFSPEAGTTTPHGCCFYAIEIARSVYTRIFPFRYYVSLFSLFTRV
jgi:hypothetical protein